LRQSLVLSWDPEKNHFDVTRFATQQRAKDFITYCMSWSIVDNNSPSGICPIDFLGHDVKHELDMLQQELSVDPSIMTNVVSIINTQQIAKEQGVYGRGDNIGLAVLTSYYDVEFRHGHTVSNDAAHTIIGAVQMVMKNKFPESLKR
jgi:hypothetical protein